MIQHLSGSRYIRYVFQGAFGFDSEHVFGSLSGLKHRPLEHHGSQLKKESPESAFHKPKKSASTLWGQTKNSLLLFTLYLYRKPQQSPYIFSVRIHTYCIVVAIICEIAVVLDTEKCNECRINVCWKGMSFSYLNSVDWTANGSWID